jgi:hypothetical protein
MRRALASPRNTDGPNARSVNRIGIREYIPPAPLILTLSNNNFSDDAVVPHRAFLEVEAMEVHDDKCLSALSAYPLTDLLLTVDVPASYDTPDTFSSHRAQHERGVF